MSSNEQSFRLTPKVFITMLLVGEGFSFEEANRLTTKLWEGLYDFGCARVGDDGLPALVIVKSEGGAFIPAVLNPFYEDNQE